MNEISLAELYDFFLDTVGRCTSDVLNRSDEEIQYELFEEFDVGAHTFLHEDNLARLRNADFIDDEMVAVSKGLREKWLALQNQSWSVEEIKTRKEWKELFALCDLLKSRQRHRFFPPPESQ